MKNMVFFILILSFVQPIMSNVIYYNDFEDSSEALTEWSYNPQFQNITPGTVQHASDRFIGQFSGNESTILSLYNLPSHNEIKVSFDLYIIRTWDGNAPPLPRAGPDIWDLSIVGEQTLLHTTFSNTGIEANQNQAYPDNFPGGNYPARTGAAESNTLGFTVVDYGGEIMDTVYHFYDDKSFPFTHVGSSLMLNFSGIIDSTIVYGVFDESWGIDNVRVDAIPESCTLGLLALGGLAVARRRR
jgi:hypothetical protein